MQDSILLSYVSLITTALMILISGLIYYCEKDKGQWIAFEYWVAAFVQITLSVFATNFDPIFMVTSLLIWPWRIRTLRRILENAVVSNLDKSWYMKALFSSYLLMLILYFSGLSFLIYTFPVSLMVFIIILDMLVASRHAGNEEKLALIHLLLQINILIIALHNLDYPFFRHYDLYSKLASSVSLLTNILMAIILPAVVVYNLKTRRQIELEETLKNQSKLSTLGEMTAGIAHEINNPLSVIINRIELLRMQINKKNPPPEEVLKGLDQIEITTKRIIDIIKSLKKLSKTEKEEFFKTVNLKDVIEETLTFCRDRFRLGNIELRIELGEDFFVSCRPVQISQIFLNLLNNSFDAVRSTENAWVEMTTVRVDNMVKVSVKDSGPGIPPEIRKNIMTLFFTTKDVDGTGLGLPLSRKMIEEHGGKLYYDETQSNTTFVVEIPLSVTHH